MANAALANTEVIITGYPKSGNTWLTRLTAELLDCPVVGFWGAQSADEIAIEGRDRRSNFRCYKAHHSYRALLGEPAVKGRKVVHVVRDPRDIALSGANYFLFERRYLLALKHLLVRLPKGSRAYFLLTEALPSSFLNERFYRRNLSTRIEKMIMTVLEGDQDTHDWCSLSWRAYVEPYLAVEHFKVRYEDLLDDPIQECHRLLDYLAVERTEQEIATAVERQSFGVVKAKFEKLGEQQKSKFLHRGQQARWRNELSERQVEKLNRGLADLLSQLGYLS